MIITKTIGPNFEADCRAAGILGMPFSWTSGGVLIDTTATDKQVEAIAAVVQAHDPTKQPPAPPVVLAKIDLWRAMTDQEHAAMVQGVASQSQRIQDIFNATDNFRSDAPEWPLLQQMAVTLYGADRAAQLLTPPKGA